MGIYDRDYLKDDESGMSGGAWMMVSRLVAINVAVYLVQILFFPSQPGQMRDTLTDLFALKADLFTHPWQFYQLLTYGFLHSTSDVWHIIGNMLVLWFLGRDVEGIYGPRVFLQFYLSTIVLSGLAWVIFEQLLPRGTLPPGISPTVVGASGGVWGVAMVFVMHYPRKTVYVYFLIPVPIWVVAAIYLFFDLVRAMQQQGVVASTAHLAGAACGYLFFRSRWQLGLLLPTRRLGSLFARRPNIRIHQEDGPDDDADLKVEVDRILEKISREGESSLTSRERRTLEDASRRYQRRGRK